MLTDFCFEGATTFVAPAAGFYMRQGAGKSTIRIAFVLNRTDTERAIKILGEGLIAYSNRQTGLGER